MSETPAEVSGARKFVPCPACGSQLGFGRVVVLIERTAALLSKPERLATAKSECRTCGLWFSEAFIVALSAHWTEEQRKAAAAAPPAEKPS